MFGYGVDEIEQMMHCYCRAGQPTCDYCISQEQKEEKDAHTADGNSPSPSSRNISAKDNLPTDTDKLPTDL